MKPTENTVFPFTGEIYSRAIHVLNSRSRNQWHSDMVALRAAMDHLIESEYANELEQFSDVFAERLVQEGGWELQLFPDYMRDKDGTVHITHEDAKALLENWPDPTRLPDGFPDQKISDIEALEEVVRLRRKGEQTDYPSEAHAYALMALEKIFTIDALVSKYPRASCLQIPFCAPPLQPSNRWKWSARQNENLFRKGCLQTPQIMSEGSSPKRRTLPDALWRNPAREVDGPIVPRQPPNSRSKNAGKCGTATPGAIEARRNSPSTCFPSTQNWKILKLFSDGVALGKRKLPAASLPCQHGHEMDNLTP